jgi:hypothetical protein
MCQVRLEFEEYLHLISDSLSKSDGKDNLEAMKLLEYTFWKYL